MDNKYVIKVLYACVAMVCFSQLPSGCADQQTSVSLIPMEPSECYPLTIEQAQDEPTLREVILADKKHEVPSLPGEKLRVVRVRYFSHRWKDGDWYGTMTVYLPDKIDEAKRGIAAIGPAGSINVEKGIDVKRDLLAKTALEFGIPVASIPSAGEHFGLTEIHELSDHTLLQVLKTGDPSWGANFAYSALRARAVTMIGKLTGTSITSVVHMGSSITAHHAWTWARFDQRVTGLVATGDIGFYTDMNPSDGSLKDKRKALVAANRAPKELRDTLLPYFDPYCFGHELTAEVLQVAGTNDPFSPPSTVAKFIPTVGKGAHLANIPNYGHGCGSARHVELFRMWIDHVFFSRPLTAIEDFQVDYESDTLTCSARIATESDLKQVSLVYTMTGEPHFLRSVRLPAAPKRNHTNAKWIIVPMRRKGDVWTATVSADTVPDYAAVFIDVQDQYRGRPGYASSTIKLVEHKTPDRDSEPE